MRHIVFEKRLYFFHFLDDAHENPLDSPFNIKPLFSLREVIPQDDDAYFKAVKNNDKNVIRVHDIGDDGESTFYEHQPTFVRKATYFFRHIMFRPLLLPLLIALLIVILLLMVKLTIHACRVREHRHIEVSHANLDSELLYEIASLFNQGYQKVIQNLRSKILLVYGKSEAHFG